ncbi:unnamed protein product [Cylicocyclus nassatus]|uniref:Uncharacterized protein n=1 Tax=Cylicocyclus nassatus TaxID=53992 RepID=A0AA36H459_CYLNA|nr:unnamed protein product [Cylicocyclus nassatus]
MFEKIWICPYRSPITKDNDKIQRWEGQDIINSSRIDKLYLENALACIAATTTGVRMNAYKRVFTELRSPIEVVHEKHENRTIQQIRTAYEREGCPTPWDIAVDDAFDSRGHSAELCKVLAVDLRTKLCIHTEVVSRREAGKLGKHQPPQTEREFVSRNVSGAMEEGFRRLLRWLRSRDIPVGSISTDRSAMYGKEIELYNAESRQNIEWHLDPWHMARYVHKNLQTVSKKCFDEPGRNLH